MGITLTRTNFRPDGIFGELKDSNNQHICYTLEHAYPSTASPSYQPKIPSGVFTCRRGQHQLPHMQQPFTTFEVMNVPGHTNILFHSGNFNSDSEGCILLGSGVKVLKNGEWMLVNSKSMFEDFMKTQDSVNEFQLTVGNK